jgi:TonB family protein
MSGCTQRLLQLCAAALLAASFAAATRAQMPLAPLDHVASQSASALDQYKATHVAVPDFATRDGSASMDRVGAKLAADFRAELAAASQKFSITSNAGLNKLMKSHQTAPVDMQNAQVAAWLLGLSHSDAWVIGEISDRAERIHVELAAYRRNKSGAMLLDSFETDVPFTPELLGLVDHPPRDAAFDAIPASNTHGYSPPACLYCPAAEYSQDASSAHIEGTVVLIATVDKTGVPHDIRVLRRLPLGLTEKAIETVGTWRMTPARTRDGQPVVVRQTIEVQFHLFD